MFPEIIHFNQYLEKSGIKNKTIAKHMKNILAFTDYLEQKSIPFKKAPDNIISYLEKAYLIDRPFSQTDFSSQMVTFRKLLKFMEDSGYITPSVFNKSLEKINAFLPPIAPVLPIPHEQKLPKEIKNLISELNSMAIWRRIETDQLILIEFRNTPYFISIMGQTGQFAGMHIYKDYLGLRCFEVLYDDLLTSADELIFLRPGFMIDFEDMTIIESRVYQTHINLTKENEEVVFFLLRHLVQIFSENRFDKADDLEIYQYENKKLSLMTYESISKRYPSLAVPLVYDVTYHKKVQKMKSQGVYFLSFNIILMSDQPFISYLLINAETQKEIAQMNEPLDDLSESLCHFLLENFVEHGKPKKLLYQNEAFSILIQAICGSLKINCELEIDDDWSDEDDDEFDIEGLTNEFWNYMTTHFLVTGDDEKLKDLLGHLDIKKLRERLIYHDIPKAGSTNKKNALKILDERLLNPNYLFETILITTEAEYAIFKEILNQPFLMFSKSSYQDHLYLIQMSLIWFKASEDEYTCWIPDEIKTTLEKIELRVLDQYNYFYNLFQRTAITAVNLYGALTLEQFKSLITTIFHDENLGDHYDAIAEVVLPLLDERNPLFYISDHVMYHSEFENDEISAQTLIKDTKPFYMPERETFYSYEDPYYFEASIEKEDLVNSLKKNGMSDEDIPYALYDIKMTSHHMDMDNLFRQLTDYGLDFNSQKSFDQFFKKFQRYFNNQRTWVNRGNRSSELPQRHSEKIGRNEPCPCGSGKKYKQCCGKNQ